MQKIINSSYYFIIHSSLHKTLHVYTNKGILFCENPFQTIQTQQDVIPILDNIILWALDTTQLAFSCYVKRYEDEYCSFEQSKVW